MLTKTIVMVAIVALCMFHGFCHGQLAFAATLIAIGTVGSVWVLIARDLIRSLRR